MLTSTGFVLLYAFLWCSEIYSTFETKIRPDFLELGWPRLLHRQFLQYICRLPRRILCLVNGRIKWRMDYPTKKVESLYLWNSSCVTKLPDDQTSTCLHFDLSNRSELTFWVFQFSSSMSAWKSTSCLSPISNRCSKSACKEVLVVSYKGTLNDRWARKHGYR